MQAEQKNTACVGICVAKANIQSACRDRYLDSSFKSKCLIPKQKPQQKSSQSKNPPCALFRGGGVGAATTARRRKEKQLLDGLQSLLQQFAEQPETQTANAIARGKGKGQGKKAEQKQKSKPTTRCNEFRILIASSPSNTHISCCKKAKCIVTSTPDTC